MTDYNLGKDEFILKQDTSVSLLEDSDLRSLDELVLTNVNVILVDSVATGLFKRDTYLMRCPLDSLRRAEDGTPQAHVTKRGSEYWLRLLFESEVVSLRFTPSTKRVATRWAQSIRQAALGNYEGVLSGDAPDMDEVMESAKGIAAAIFGPAVKSESPAKPAAQAKTLASRPKANGGARDAKQTAQAVAAHGKCIGCRAPLVGRKGYVVTCAYCDTKQTL